MNFDDTPAEAAWRAEVRAWIAASRLPVPATRRRRDATPGWLALARRWQAIKADAGYVGLAWPGKWHGAERSVAEAIIFDQEEAAAGLHFPFFEITLGLCIPTVATYADQATIDRLAPSAMRGQEVWCQLFSEPGAGSDIAGLRTRALREGDDWIVDGQKVWTSGGQYADYGLLITRTDPDVPKHRGLTVFWLDLRTPGVEVRPIRQASGIANFNEVFLTGVRIPDAQRLGPVDGGWGVTLTTLMNERVSIGDVGGPDVAAAIQLVASTPGADGQAARHMLVDHFVRAEGVRLTRARMLTAISRGEKPGPENAIGKLVAASEMQALARDALLARGPMGMVVERGEGAAADGIFADSLTWSPGYRLAGGADEILRTVIAERVLGLPAEPRPDKDQPFARR